MEPSFLKTVRGCALTDQEEGREFARLDGGEKEKHLIRGAELHGWTLVWGLLYTGGKHP